MSEDISESKKFAIQFEFGGGAEILSNNYIQLNDLLRE